MTSDVGISIKGLKQKNLLLLLKLIATQPGLSRIDLAKITHITKMTVTNIISELLELGIITEEEGPASRQPTNGRIPTPLALSSSAPKIIGVLIKRGLYQVVLGDLAGNILDSITERTPQLEDAGHLLRILFAGVDTLRERARGPLLAVGISSIGPLDAPSGVLLNPPNFWGIENLPIVREMEKHTGLPAFLINDGNAGALCEKMYGSGKEIPNFLYVHLKYGIGSGLVLHNDLYHGNRGQSGEIGHSTINFVGPRCPCGNVGCLELYANITNVRSFIAQQLPLYPDTRIKDPAAVSLVHIIDLANQNDLLAVSALNEYCDYLSHAILNVLNILDISYIIMDYESNLSGSALEDLLLRKLQARISDERFRTLRVLRSQHHGQAPLVGALALVADNVFHGRLEIPLSSS